MLVNYLDLLPYIETLKFHDPLSVATGRTCRATVDPSQTTCEGCVFASKEDERCLLTLSKNPTLQQTLDELAHHHPEVFI